jgi:hypothetical protein
VTPLPNVRCARCGKVVDRLRVMRDEASLQTNIRVWCHGETEEMDMPDDVLVTIIDVGDIREGVAFVSLTLPSPQRLLS